MDYATAQTNESLQRLFDIANWFAQVEMLWRVSSTALIGSLLAGCWVKRDELRSDRRWARYAYHVGLVFLASVVAYGVLTTGLGFRLGAAGLGACAAVGRAECNSSVKARSSTGSRGPCSSGRRVS